MATPPPSVDEDLRAPNIRPTIYDSDMNPHADHILTPRVQLEV